MSAVHAHVSSRVSRERWTPDRRRQRTGSNMASPDIIGISGATVSGTATVNVFTGGLRVMPMFAVPGCDYGNQTLADPATGTSTATVPTLYVNADTNTIELTADTQILTDSTGTDVDSLVKDSTGDKPRFEGSRWSAARRIGFFRRDRQRHRGAHSKARTPSGVTGFPKNEPEPTRDRLHQALATAHGTVMVQLDIPAGPSPPKASGSPRVAGHRRRGHWSRHHRGMPIRVGQSCSSAIGRRFRKLRHPGVPRPIRRPRTTSPSTSPSVWSRRSRHVARIGRSCTTRRSQASVEEGEHEAVISEHDTLRTGATALARSRVASHPATLRPGSSPERRAPSGSLTTAPTTEDRDPDGGCGPDERPGLSTPVSIPSDPVPQR